MCSQQSKGAKYPQKSFNCADAFSIKITRFHAALKPIFRSLKPFQAFSSLLNLGARDFSFYMNTHNGASPSHWSTCCLYSSSFVGFGADSVYSGFCGDSAYRLAVRGSMWYFFLTLCSSFL